MYIHIYIYTFPSSATERALEQQYSVVMSTVSVHVFASKYHSPVKGISAPWINGRL